MARCLQSAHSAQRNSHADCRFVDRAAGRARGRCRQRRPVRGDLGARERRPRADARSRAVRGARRQLAFHRRRLPLRLSAASTICSRCCPRWRTRTSRTSTSAPTPRSSISTTCSSLTQFRTDPDLCEILVRNSLETAAWVRAPGREAAAGPGPAGLQGRRQVQVLGRARAAHLGRRAGTAQGALRQCRAARHPDRLRDAGRRVSSASAGA